MLRRVVTPAEALCPRCRTPRLPLAAECPSCGVIYARYVLPQRRPVTPAPTARSPRPLYLPSARLEALCLRLAEMLEAGLPLRQALTGPLVDTFPGPLAGHLRQGAARDAPLSDIVESVGLLDAASLAQLRAGESRGGLPQALRQVAQRLHERRVSYNLLVGGLAYPAFLLLCAAVLVPAPVLFTGGLGAYLRQVLPPVALLVALALAVALWPRLAPEAAPRRALRAVGFALPLVCSVLRHHALGTFADLLGSSLQAGLPMRQALSLATGATEDPSVQRRSGEALQRLDGGATLVAALEPLALPPDFLAEVATGEHAGTLDRALPRLAATHREHARRATRVLLGAVAFAVFALAAVAVAVSIIRGYAAAFGQLEHAVEQLERR